MKIDNQNYQSIWADENDPSVIRVIDQQKLPFFFETRELRSVEDVFNAIEDMTVGGHLLLVLQVLLVSISQLWRSTCRQISGNIFQMQPVISYPPDPLPLIFHGQSIM
jgi:hypothetical protein